MSNGHPNGFAHTFRGAIIGGLAVGAFSLVLTVTLIFVGQANQATKVQETTQKALNDAVLDFHRRDDLRVIQFRRVEALARLAARKTGATEAEVRAATHSGEAGQETDR